MYVGNVCLLDGEMLFGFHQSSFKYLTVDLLEKGVMFAETTFAKNNEHNWV